RAEAYQPNFGDRSSLIGCDREILMVGCAGRRIVDDWPAGFFPAVVLLVEIGRLEVLDVFFQVSHADAGGADASAAGEYPAVGQQGGARVVLPDPASAGQDRPILCRWIPSL